MDAYDIIPKLGQLAISPQSSIYGATGILYLTPNQHVHRKLPWAKMIHGQPEKAQP